MTDPKSKSDFINLPPREAISYAFKMYRVGKWKLKEYYAMLKYYEKHSTELSK